MRTVRNMECAYLAFTSDGSRLIAVTNDNTVSICDPMSGVILQRQHLENPVGHYQGPLLFAFDDKERIILTASHNALSVRAWHIGPGGTTAAWDRKTGKLLWQQSFEGTQGLTGITRDGRLGVAWDMTLRETDTGQVVGQLFKPGAVGEFANHKTVFSADGSLIATHCSLCRGAGFSSSFEDLGIEVWDRATCRLLRRFPVTGGGHSFTFSADGRQLAVVRSNEVWVWDVASGRELLHHESGHGATWQGVGLVFVPDGRALAMATEDGSILLWEVPSEDP